MTGPTYLRPPLGGVGIGDFSLHDFAAKWMMQQDDIAEIGVFAAANAALAPAAGERIVMFGDSITAFWDFAPCDDARRHFVNRGIPGQNSSQMLLRFVDDAIALQPQTVVILCGANDLRSYVGDPASVGASALTRIRRNLRAMCDIAAANGVRVVLCTLPPVGADRDAVNRDASAIVAVNRWIADFATGRGYRLADYHAALIDGAGHLAPADGEDGIHPSVSGYAKMWPALQGALS